jgi:hypothetical protein
MYDSINWRLLNPQPLPPRWQLYGVQQDRVIAR